MKWQMWVAFASRRVAYLTARLLFHKPCKKSRRDGTGVAHYAAVPEVRQRRRGRENFISGRAERGLMFRNLRMKWQMWVKESVPPAMRAFRYATLRDASFFPDFGTQRWDFCAQRRRFKILRRRFCFAVLTAQLYSELW